MNPYLLMIATALTITTPVASIAQKAGSISEVKVEPAPTAVLMPKADAGDAKAQLELAWHYERQRNWALALHWYQLAAEQGVAGAQTNLGVLHQLGRGALQSYSVAAEWYKKASDQGEAVAQSNLAQLYFHGLGVPQDYVEASVWYFKAASQGFAKAQYNLGIMYYEGKGVAKDNTLSYVWSNLAASALSGKDGSDAAKNRDVAASKMTSMQIDIAQRMAQTCQASNYKSCDYSKPANKRQ